MDSFFFPGCFADLFLICGITHVYVGMVLEDGFGRILSPLQGTQPSNRFVRD
jgi:hypothetical protein